MRALTVPTLVMFLAGCDVATVETNPNGGSGGRSPAQPCVTEADAGAVHATCQSDCDCAQGLSCQVCVNTADHNCIEWCAPGDPKCNNGVVTCPVKVGLDCPGVTVCLPAPQP